MTSCSYYDNQQAVMFRQHIIDISSSVRVYCYGLSWASYQIRNIAGCACAGNAGNVFPRHRLQRKPLVSDPGMHHGTCVTHVPWCMSGSLASGGGQKVPGIPGACAPAIFRIWQEAHGDNMHVLWYLMMDQLLFTWTKWSLFWQTTISKAIFLNGNDRIPIRISRKFVPRGPIDNKPALVQAMAWCQTVDKPLPELMLTQFTDANIRF